MTGHVTAIVRVIKGPRDAGAALAIVMTDMGGNESTMNETVMVPVGVRRGLNVLIMHLLRHHHFWKIQQTWIQRR